MSRHRWRRGVSGGASGRSAPVRWPPSRGADAQQRSCCIAPTASSSRRAARARRRAERARLASALLLQVVHVGRLDGHADKLQARERRHIAALLVVGDEERQALHALELHKVERNCRRAVGGKVGARELEHLRRRERLGVIEAHARAIDVELERPRRALLRRLDQQRVQLDRLVERHGDQELLVAVGAHRRVHAAGREHGAEGLRVGSVEHLGARHRHEPRQGRSLERL
mmetsp:Transcript_4867/g.15070  ORF Transcript_4867/g.15070 Transcript_4867/m.15070 type:complete len:229 (+) Transcript_4867:400-1086(+)